MDYIPTLFGLAKWVQVSIFRARPTGARSGDRPQRAKSALAGLLTVPAAARFHKEFIWGYLVSILYERVLHKARSKEKQAL